MASRPSFVVEKAVLGMLPKNRLGRAMGRKLTVYDGGEHPHSPQKPVELKLGEFPKWSGLPQPAPKKTKVAEKPDTPAKKKTTAKRATAKPKTAAAKPKSTAKKTTAKKSTVKKTTAKKTTTAKSAAPKEAAAKEEES